MEIFIIEILKIIILKINRLRQCALVYVFNFLGDLTFLFQNISCVSHE